MGCCRKFLKPPSSSRSVICVKWVLPLRVLVLSSLAIHLYVYLLIMKERLALLTFLIIILLVVAFSLLQECRRSADSHRKFREKS